MKTENGMSIEDYKKTLAEMQNEFDLKKKQLSRDFALSNNPYKVGDIISDWNTTIKIENIRYDFPVDNGIPECVYTGIKLRKDGTVSKRQDSTKIYQSNIQTTTK